MLIRRFGRGWLLARAADQFRQSDVTIWGIVALVCGAIAIGTAGISALIPDDALARLHASRLSGASLTQLRGEIANIEQKTANLQAENARLSNRFGMAEKADGDVTRRVGALETSMPQLIESLPQNQIDTSTITGAIGTNPNVRHFDVDGGSVTVTHSPLTLNDTQSLSQPLPPMPTDTPIAPLANANAFGIAIGPGVTQAEAAKTYQDLSLKLGTLLLGLAPLLGTAGADGTHHIVVGPVADDAEARALCKHVDRVGVNCMPTRYTGDTLNN